MVTSDPASMPAAKRALLDAGRRLIEQRGFAGVRVDAVVDTAGTAKGTFYRYFASQDDFFVALHQGFVAEITGDVATAAVGMAPGTARLRRCLVAYLDACSRQAGMKAFLTEARTVPAVSKSVENALAMTAALAVDDYRAAGADHPNEAAQLLIAMAHEVAITERTRGANPRLREQMLYMAGLDAQQG